MKRILLSLSFVSILSIANLFCEQGNPSVSAILEVFGSTIADGLNMEYSPNRYLDFGIGFMPAKYAIPFDLHAYFRYNLLNTAVSPFIELSSLVMLWQDGKNDNWATRLHVGIAGRFKSGFILGLSFGYQIIGSDFLFFNNLGRFVPGAFVGWKLPAKIK